MADVVDKATRSRMMAGIGSKGTAPELRIRSLLHRAGFRFRLHAKHLPGRPDLVLPKFEAAIFVHGCFWHRHECHLFKWPSSNRDFWFTKIHRNAERDEFSRLQLEQAGWRVATVWECALRKSGADSELVERLADWLRSGKSERLEIAATDLSS